MKVRLLVSRIIISYTIAIEDARGLLPPTSKMRFDPSQKRYPLAAYKYQSLTHIEEFKYVNLRYETLEFVGFVEFV